MAISFSNGFSIGTTPPQSLSFFTNLVTMASYLRNYMSDFRNPDFYSYELDRDGFYINDGGNDMYDDGNATTPWLISNVTYTGDTDYSVNDYPYAVDYQTTGTTGTVDTTFGYVSLGYDWPNLLPLTVIGTRATSASPGTPIGFQCGGNIGADGDGTFVEGNIYTGDTVSGFTVHAYYKETYDAGDPAVCDVFILLGHPDWNSVFGDVFYGGDSSNNGCGSFLYTTGNGCQNVLAIKTLLSKDNNEEVTFSEVQTVVDNFIMRINELVSNLPTSTPSPTATVTGTPEPTPTPSATPAPLTQYSNNGSSNNQGLIISLDGTVATNGNQILDQSGNGNDFTISGALGSSSTYYDFTNSSYATLNNSSILNNLLNTMSITMWVNLPSVPGGSSLFSRTNNNTSGWAFRTSSGQFNLVKYNVADQYSNGTFSLSNNTWYHIGIVQGGSSLMFTLNGEIVGSIDGGSSSNFANNSNPFMIAKDTYINSLVDMKLATFKVWDTFKTSSDILSEFDAEKGSYGYSASPTPTPSTTPNATASPTPEPTSTSTPSPTPTSTSGAFTITLSEVGPNVVMTGTGSIDLTGLTLVTSGAGPMMGAGMGVSSATFIGGATGGYYDTYSGFTTTPTSFGSGGGGAASLSSGDLFGVIMDMAPPYLLLVPSGYTSGTPISGSQTFSGGTFTTLGLTPGTYTYTWSGGSIDVIIGALVPTATPTSTGPTPTPTSTNNGVGSWYFYSDDGQINAGPPVSNGNAIFTINTGMTQYETFNPNKADGVTYLYFNLKDSVGTNYTSQFSGYTGGTGTITISQNGDTATYTSTTPGSFIIESFGGPSPIAFMISTAACTQTKSSNAPYVLTDPISITFS